MGEVLVVGGGMAGAIAALRARALGARVRLVRRALGATALSSGAIDVAADPTAPPGDLVALAGSPYDAAKLFARSRPLHPYAVLHSELERLPEALGFAAQSLPELLTPPQDLNALLPTPLGTVKPAAMGQRSVMAGDVTQLAARVVVVQPWGNPLVDAHLVAKGVAQAARVLGRAVELSVLESRFFGQYEDALRQPVELGERLDAQGALDAFARDIQERLPTGARLLLVPAVLGRRLRGLAPQLEALLGVPCAELLATAPSLPGIRLQEALDEALSKAGVPLEEGRVTLEPDGALFVEGRTLSADAVVLATGKFIGGGIVREGAFGEPVFGLPVFAGPRALGGEFIGNLLDADVAGEQLAFHAGVRIDAQLRPLGADGVARRERLFAAGAVIGGYDPAADKTGLGVAIFTGYLAGERAAQSLG
jgi:glycerol-3-phosphate dehydrogenase subunit B